MPRIPPQADAQYGVFTTEQAVAAGWSRDALMRAAKNGRLVRLRRAAYVSTDRLDTANMEAQLHGLNGVAAALRVRHAVVSHAAAAALHGLPLLTPPAEPCITLPPELRTRPASLHLHRQRLPAEQLDPGVAVVLTSVARTCLDLTREMGILAGLVSTDAALHIGLTTPDELENVYRSLHGGSGLPSGRMLLEQADGRSESPLESISRFHLRTLPDRPEIQVRLHAQGRLLGRVDFFWRSAGLVGEADGMAKYDDAELRREKLRQDAMLRAGLLVTRWGWRTAIDPERLRAQILGDLASAAALRQAGLPMSADAA